MPQTYQHQPVLLSAVLKNLMTNTAGIYIDATFGRGGHSQAILKQLNAQGKLYAIDKDPEAIAHAQHIHDVRFQILHGSFIHIDDFAATLGIHGNVSGILLDLGVSSPQLDNAARGFSFRHEGPLDMRMDPASGTSVASWLQMVKENILANILKTYGEERFARRIAKAIITARKIAPIITTKQLADIVAAAHPAWEQDKHPATRTFQALRIFINQELDALRTVLPRCLKTLKIGGRLAVISFHSLEDRIVKQFIRESIQGDDIVKQLPIRHHQLPINLRCVGRAIRPSNEEIQHNPRSRSAVLRIMEKMK